jgi:hypothetical protein
MERDSVLSNLCQCLRIIEWYDCVFGGLAKVRCMFSYCEVAG